MTSDSNRCSVPRRRSSRPIVCACGSGSSLLARHRSPSDMLLARASIRTRIRSTLGQELLRCGTQQPCDHPLPRPFGVWPRIGAGGAEAGLASGDGRVAHRRPADDRKGVVVDGISAKSGKQALKSSFTGDRRSTCMFVSSSLRIVVVILVASVVENGRSRVRQ